MRCHPKIPSRSGVPPWDGGVQVWGVTVGCCPGVGCHFGCRLDTGCRLNGGARCWVPPPASSCAVPAQLLPSCGVPAQLFPRHPQTGTHRRPDGDTRACERDGARPCLRPPSYTPGVPVWDPPNLAAGSGAVAGPLSGTRVCCLSFRIEKRGIP